MPKMSASSRHLARPFAAALLVVVSLAASAPVRAEEPASPQAEEMVLVPLKTVQSLEQRVIFLEESVAALTESWQHIDTHRICATDGKGAETCITKAQLDALLAHADQAALVQPAETTHETAVANEPVDGADPVMVAATAFKDADKSSEKQAAEVVIEAPVVQETRETARTDEPVDGADPAVVAATASKDAEKSPEKQAEEAVIAEPAVQEAKQETAAADAPVDGADPVMVAATLSTHPERDAAEASLATSGKTETDPETTGSVQPAITDAAVLSFPHVEIYEEPAAKSAD
jgi:hypothetical protein